MPVYDDEVTTYAKAAAYEYGDIVTLWRIRNSPDMIVECELDEQSSKTAGVRNGVRVFWFGDGGSKEVAVFPKDALHWHGSIEQSVDDDNDD